MLPGPGTHQTSQHMDSLVSIVWRVVLCSGLSVLQAVFCQASLCPSLIRNFLSGRLGAMECPSQMPQGCPTVPSGELGMLEGLQLEIQKKVERAESHPTWAEALTQI